MNACKICGTEIQKKNQLYCSKRCAGIAARKKQHEHYLKRKGIEQTNRDAGKNRPYTRDTAMLIRLYRSRGESVEQIARVLDRSIENVMLALEGENK